MGVSRERLGSELEDSSPDISEKGGVSEGESRQEEGSESVAKGELRRISGGR